MLSEQDSVIACVLSGTKAIFLSLGNNSIFNGFVDPMKSSQHLMTRAKPK